MNPYIEQANQQFVPVYNRYPIVLDHGEIVGRGTHEELLTTNEIYSEIARSQLNNQSLTEE